MVGDDLTNLDKDIDLFAEEVLNLPLREALDIDGGGLFASLLRGFLFLFGRVLRAVIIDVMIKRLVTLVVVLVQELIRVLHSLKEVFRSGH